jgi:hypothetical protein
MNLIVEPGPSVYFAPRFISSAFMVLGLCELLPCIARFHSHMNVSNLLLSPPFAILCVGHKVFNALNVFLPIS